MPIHTNPEGESPIAMSAKRAKTAPNVTVRVKEGRAGKYPCTRQYHGDILVDDEVAGSFSVTFVDRKKAGAQFHTACDAESSELQELGCVLFGSDGTPRYPALKNDASVKSGGFLYIDSWKVAAEHCKDGSTEIGAWGLRALLLSCPRIGSKWRVAAYIAESQGVDEDPFSGAMERFHAQMAGIPEDPAEKRVRMSKRNDAMAKDSLQFLRAGFAELAQADGGWLYITGGMLKSVPDLMTHEAALAMPLRLKKDSSQAATGLTAKDEELLAKLVASSERSTAETLQLIDGLVADGANLSRAAVLHFAVANGRNDMIQPLLSRGANVNAKDPRARGATALMIAASKALSKVRRDMTEHDTHMVAMLIALGADKNVVDDEGCSALGYYYAAIRGMNDFNAALLGHVLGGPRYKVDKTLQVMLTPTSGPTAADMDRADDH